MADQTIMVVQNTTPILTYQLRNFRNLSDPYALVNITGYTFKLIVKPALIIDDEAISDARAFFDLTGSIVTAASGIFRFTLTSAHTVFAAGTYPGQIRWWTGTPGTGEQPDDSWSVDYVVQPRVRFDEP